jgi:putative peptidoglycan lipid II flippase
MSALARGSTIFRDIIVAARFGRSDGYEAFVNAFVVPTLIASVLAGSVNAAFIATYIRVREHRGQEAAFKLVGSITTLAGIALTLAALILLAARQFVLAPMGIAFSDEKRALMSQTYVALLMIVPLSGLSTVYAGLLNAEGRFVLAAVAPAAIPAASVIAILALPRAWGIQVLTIGVIAGFAIQAVVLGIGAKRTGLPVRPQWLVWDSDLRDVARLYAPAVMAALLMSTTTAIDQSMAGMLAPGSVSALNYGSRLIALITTLGATAIATVLGPRLSELVAKRAWDELRALCKNYAILIAVVTIPLTVAVFFSSGFIVRWTFQYGTFTAQDAIVVADVQRWLALQIPPYALGMVSVALITALRRTNVFFYGNLINMTVNVVMNYVLMRRIGVPGIALSTSLVYMVSSAFLAWAAIRAVRREASSVAPC